MRQDMAFVPGEVVSQRHLGHALATWFDAVITVDPHLRRVATMNDVVPGRRGVALGAAELLGAWVAAQVPAGFLLAPDEEAGPWARLAARAHGLDVGVCSNERLGGHSVRVVPRGAAVASGGRPGGGLNVVSVVALICAALQPAPLG